jgi:hypothetical protein
VGKSEDRSDWMLTTVGGVDILHDCVVRFSCGFVPGSGQHDGVVHVVASSSSPISGAACCELRSGVNYLVIPDPDCTCSMVHDPPVLGASLVGEECNEFAQVAIP